MNKIFKFSLLLLAFTFIFSSCSSDDDDNETVIDYSELPQTTQNFIEKYLPNQMVTIAKEASVVNYATLAKYYVYLTGGYELDFDTNGNWVQIELDQNGALSNNLVALLPVSIQTYIANNYPNVGVNEFGKQLIGNSTVYKVELVNDLDLIFNAQGEFVRIDR